MFIYGRTKCNATDKQWCYDPGSYFPESSIVFSSSIQFFLHSQMFNFSFRFEVNRFCIDEFTFVFHMNPFVVHMVHCTLQCTSPINPLFNNACHPSFPLSACRSTRFISHMISVIHFAINSRVIRTKLNFVADLWAPNQVSGVKQGK